LSEGPNKFTIQTSDKHDVTKLQIGFDGPSQPQCKLTTNKDKSVDVTYTAAVAGDYKIHIRYDEKPLNGSPFKCKIVGDVKASVSKVKLLGATKEAKINADNEVVVDGREVGICGKPIIYFSSPSDNIPFYVCLAFSFS